ncbi:MAG: thiol-disulfide oxidoreductase DCC family protein [Pyrinomonadaceae bacterium]
MSAIVLFDGVCNFCNDWVNFIIERDRKDHFKFAPLQSDTARRFLEEHNVDPEETDSVVVIENEKAYTYSTAALRITRGLGGLWAVFYALIIVPKPIRDAVYKWIAGNRYKWFGKKEACMIPTPEVREKFLS